MTHRTDDPAEQLADEPPEGLPAEFREDWQFVSDWISGKPCSKSVADYQARWRAALERLAAASKLVIDLQNARDEHAYEEHQRQMQLVGERDQLRAEVERLETIWHTCPTCGHAFVEAIPRAREARSVQ